METNEVTGGADGVSGSASSTFTPSGPTPVPISNTPPDLAPTTTHEDYGYLGNLRTGDTLPGAKESNIQQAAREGRDYLDNVNKK